MGTFPDQRRFPCATCAAIRLTGQLRTVPASPAQSLPELRICLRCYDRYLSSGRLHPSLWARPPS